MHYQISGNYRLSEFQAAILNCQLDRLAEQTETRDHNGAYLGEQMQSVPGVRPQGRDVSTTRHAYHLFVFRYDPAVYGVSRATYVRALCAEGIQATEGYPLPLYRQPLFLDKAFGPYSGCLSARPGFAYSQSDCPVCEKACGEEGTWLPQKLLLGTTQEMDNIVRAMEKIYHHRDELVEIRKQEASA